MGLDQKGVSDGEGRASLVAGAQVGERLFQLREAIGGGEAGDADVGEVVAAVDGLALDAGDAVEEALVQRADDAAVEDFHEDDLGEGVDAADLRSEGGLVLEQGAGLFGDAVDFGGGELVVAGGLGDHEADALDGGVPVGLGVGLDAGDGGDGLEDGGDVGADGVVGDLDEEGGVGGAAALPLGLEGLVEEADGVSGLEAAPGLGELGGVVGHAVRVGSGVCRLRVCAAFD